MRKKCEEAFLNSLPSKSSLATTDFAHFEDPFDRKCCWKELRGALGCIHTIKLCSMNFASYRAKIDKGFYAGVQMMTVRIIEVEYGNCGFVVS